jgi:hypothetical protein
MRALAVLAGFGLAIVIGVVSVSLLTWFWKARSRHVQVENPHGWVRPMVLGRSFYVLALNVEQIALVGLFGRKHHEHARSELVNAEIGSIRFPAATRRCLSLRFSDGDELKLLTMRRGGLVSTVPDAESAIRYLTRASAN